jgi:hypothetical protein
MAALERKADIVGAGFRMPWNERQLSPKAVIQNCRNGLISGAANGQNQPLIRFSRSEFLSVRTVCPWIVAAEAPEVTFRIPT